MVRGHGSMGGRTYSGCKNCNATIFINAYSSVWKHRDKNSKCKKPEPGGKCDDKWCTCQLKPGETTEQYLKRIAKKK